MVNGVLRKTRRVEAAGFSQLSRGTHYKVRDSLKPSYGKLRKFGNTPVFRRQRAETGFDQHCVKYRS